MSVPYHAFPSRVDRLMATVSQAIFVFGSNRSGVHGRGAALAAVRQYGAVRGQGTGLQGRSYAIPTRTHRNGTLVSLSPTTILANIAAAYAVGRTGCWAVGVCVGLIKRLCLSRRRW